MELFQTHPTLLTSPLWRPFIAINKNPSVFGTPLHFFFGTPTWEPIIYTPVFRCSPTLRAVPRPRHLQLKRVQSKPTNQNPDLKQTLSKPTNHNPTLQNVVLFATRYIILEQTILIFEVNYPDTHIGYINFVKLTLCKDFLKVNQGWASIHRKKDLFPLKPSLIF